MAHITVIVVTIMVCPRCFQSPLRLPARRVHVGSIAKRVADRLTWTVYNQENLEYLAGNDAAQAELQSELSPEALVWQQNQLQALQQRGGASNSPGSLSLARVIYGLTARGQAIFVGRGAGFYLPPLNCLHVRIIANLADRVQHMQDWLRLTPQQAEDQVLQKDQQRKKYLSEQFGERLSDICAYDLTINSSSLGEETCSDCIIVALNGKRESWDPGSSF
ncbi:MAG: cytidylate kinase family protein [Zavarzinella sp.]